MGKETKQLLKAISETWKLEARQEREDLFYYIKEINRLREGDKCYVIGRKGMGKTAISEYFYKTCSSDSFSERLSFKNFPFHFLYEFVNDNYTKPNQYITIWKYLIYNAVCKMMARNEGIDGAIQSKLRKLYPMEPIRSLDKVIRNWTAKGFGVEVLGCGGHFDRDKTNEDISWKEKTEIFGSVIEKYGNDESYYYVLIDELDEDYREYQNADDLKTYLNLITSLFKAVQDIKSCFFDTGIKIRPILFLRSDIFSLIRDSDKNKWNEHIINLSWKPQELFKMICHRLYVSSDYSIEEKDVWETLVPQKYVNMGNRGQNRMNSFDYITRSTHWRPRDYIHYIRESAREALDSGADSISSGIIKKVDGSFSEYLRREVTDEIFAVLPNIDQIFSVLSQIRKQTFSPNTFLESYCSTTGRSLENGRFVLRQLFEYSVIGNQPSMKGQQIFKYQYPDTLFNFNENMIVHRGLYKALQIF